METLGLSSQKNKALNDTLIHCRIRKEWIVATPEERIRQKLLAYMIEDLAFPASQIALEKALKQMPHLQLESRYAIPNRRADITCFAKGIHSKHNLFPLLVVECKAVALNAKFLNQVLGYNHFLGAYFVCLANQQEIRTGWYDTTLKTYRFIDYLPSYDHLLRSLKISNRDI
jgi:hypothetical protein